MKSANKVKQWLVLLLCVLMAAGVMTQAAGAAEATGKCTNVENEGIEYFSIITVMGSDVNLWRGELAVSVTRFDDKTIPAGKVIGMEIEVTNDNTRYQCTQLVDNSYADNKTYFSCNSIPVNAIINGVYFLYKPEGVQVDTQIDFLVESAVQTDPVSGKLAGLHGTTSKVSMPPYPCARNLVARDFAAESGKALVAYTVKDCKGVDVSTNSASEVKFIEKYADKDKYAIVNITNLTNTLEDDRMHITVSPNESYNYTLDLIFHDAHYDSRFGESGYTPIDENANKNNYVVRYTYNATTKTGITTVPAANTFSELNNYDLPLILVGGKIYDMEAKENDGWGKPAFPTSSDLNIRFYYENYTGTLGFENSVFHVERNLNIKFAGTCSETAESTALYDPCQSTRQMFSATLPKNVVIDPTTGHKEVYYGTDTSKQTVDNKQTDGTLRSVWFVTRKCVNTACDYVTSTNAYPYSVTMSDGGGSARTYGNKGVRYDLGTASRFEIRPYYYKTDSVYRPFSITGVRMVVEEPGTYVVYAFANYTKRGNTVLNKDDYAEKFYVTVNNTDELLTCSSLANNGYFRAYWNDCLSPSETQLIPFEHIAGTEEAWVRNRSAHAVDFPFVAEYSYLPQKLEVASLNCTFEALESGGRPGDGYCNHYNVHVPPYTKVTITGGTMYMSGYPQYDEYRVAYMREDTMNISHLFFSIQVKACESKKIPDTGISLRSPMSPLKVNQTVDLNIDESVDASVDAATSYVFTGNSLQIPAIGLGMETPIPIVHVYYEEGSNQMVWDLSTLGNYVGELEGGSYIPYGGNSVLTGHFWSGGVFKNLQNLNYEDEVIIYANDGIKYTYKVAQKFIAQPDDVYEMFQQIGERSLTLVTCENYNLVTDKYERRYIVRAMLVDQEPYDL